MKSSKEIFYLFLCMLSIWVISTLTTWYIWVNQSGHARLSDVMFNWIPNYSHIEIPIPNYIGLIQMIVVLLSFHEKHYARVAQFLLLNSVILLMRSIISVVTEMPNIAVYSYCKTNPSDFFELVKFMMIYGTCSDYMFSGHTAAVFLLYMFCQKYKSSYIFQVVSGILVGIMILVLLSLRWHYTSDILVAIIIVWFLFKFYEHNEQKYYDRWFYFPKLQEYKLNCTSTKDRKNRQIQKENVSKFRLERYF